MMNLESGPRFADICLVAFDIVNVPLLVKRLMVIGLPNDVVDLIEIWLKEHYFFNWLNSTIDTYKVHCKKLLLKS